MRKNNAAVIENALVQCHVVFHQDEPAFSPDFPTDDAGRTAPPADAGATTVDQAPTDTANPQNATPTVIRVRKSISNLTQPVDSLGAK